MVADRQGESIGAGAAPRLLAWYDRHRRELPWRAPPGRLPDPYRVWLSEVMLQQTTVAAVTGYFERFIERWPTVRHLADASLDEVLHAWQGLGYYARARNLHRCARVVADEHDGRFPDTEDALRVLPGIGAYTAAAVAAIAFDRPATVVDGNVERVVARLFAVGAPLPGAKKTLRGLARELTPAERPGDYAQAMMDLGATVCTPRKPRCGACPLAGLCLARASGRAEALPARESRTARPTRYGIVFWLEDRDGALWLRRRPAEGLLGGLMELPSGPWTGTPGTLDEAAAALDLEAAEDLRLLPGEVHHTFTHFHLVLRVARGHAPASLAGALSGSWSPPERLEEYALPTVMKKVVRLVQAEAEELGGGKKRTAGRGNRPSSSDRP